MRCHSVATHRCVHIASEGAAPVDPPTISHYRIVLPGYIEAMRIPLRAGRTFTDADTADRPLVAIVNETLRREGWGARNPVGTRITLAGTYAPPNERWAEVVGVVADVRHFGPGTPPPPEMYWPAEQIDAVPGEALRRMRRGLTLVISTEAGEPLSIVPSVRAAVRAVDPDQPIAKARTMTSLMSASLWLSRAAAWLLTVFGGAALNLCAARRLRPRRRTQWRNGGANSRSGWRSARSRSA
jgi:hypothetical protein